MRRIDMVKNMKMKNVKYITILDKKRLKIVFKNNEEIVILARGEDYGTDCGIYIEQDNI
ncbi:hypothetical protein [Peribacillus asahii]|uniref:hypothetical protein n=1 Tax=Peribacillus asahii TaxID=228899 RepID=UPI00381AB23B